MEGVSAAGSPSGDHCDNNFGHKPDEALDLKDVETSAGRGAEGARGRSSVGVLVSIAATDALVAAAAERPAAVLGARAVAGEEDNTDLGVLAGVIQCAIQFVDRVRAERVAHLGAVEGDAVSRWYVMSVSDSKPGTSTQSVGSNRSDTAEVMSQAYDLGWRGRSAVRRSGMTAVLE
jgi:hypothetical protein